MKGEVPKEVGRELCRHIYAFLRPTVGLSGQVKRAYKVIRMLELQEPRGILSVRSHAMNLDVEVQIEANRYTLILLAREKCQNITYEVHPK